MDKEAEKLEKQENLAFINAYLSHPITIELLKDCDDQVERGTALVLDHPVVSLETFLAREQALGHLRAMRQFKAMLQDKVAEIHAELKEL
jgi:hypothetical protein